MSQFQTNPNLSGVSAGGQLEPLQQTVFEKGPQSTFTPPPVANVYQEGKTIFPSPEARIIDSGINWYGLGAEAFKLAGDAYANTIDYLINGKIAGVKDAQDEAQAKLYDVESKISVEQYNANHEKRPRQEDMIKQLLSESNAIKSNYKERVRTILGKDHDALMAPNLDMNTIGSKYQELALTSRSSDRNVDKVYNRMFYQLEHVTRGMQQQTEAANAWYQGGERDNKVNQNFMFGGLFPVPIASNGRPAFGVQDNQDGSWAVKTTQTGEPLLIKTDDGYHFNPQAIEAMGYDDAQNLYTASMRTGGNYVFSPAACQLTHDTEQIAQHVAKSVNANPGMSIWVGTVLSNMPDDLRNATIDRIPDLNANERIKLHLVTDYVRQKLPSNNISAVSNLDPNEHGGAFKTAVDNYNGLLHYDIYANRADTETVNQVNRNIDITAAIANALDPAHAVNADKYHVVRLGQSNELAPAEGNLRISKLLQDNPQMMPTVIRCMASMEVNRNLFTDAGGRVDAEKFNATLGRLIKSELSSTGWVRLDTPNNQTPRFVFNPGLVSFQKTNEQFLHNPEALSALPPETRKQVEEDPEFRLRMQATSVLVGNAPQKREEQIALARSISPTVDINMLGDLLDATAATQEKNITNNPGTGRIEVSTALRVGDLMRMAVACTPANWQQVDPRALTNDDTKRAAIKAIMDDLPTSSPDPKNRQPYPWMDVAMDLGPNSLSNLEASNGGIPIGITKIRGLSKNTDFLGVMVQQGTQPLGLGMYTPKTGNGPALRINAVQMDEAGRAIKYAGEYEENLKRVYHAFAGIHNYRPTAFNEAPGGSLPTPEVVQNVIEAAQPHVTNSILTSFGNPLMQEQLTTADNAIANLRQNGKALDDVVSSDPSLRQVRGLLHEVARMPDPKDPSHYNEMTNTSRRILFSDETLTRLYDRAVEHGAKTQADFVTWVLGAMKEYHENSNTLYTRDYALQNSLDPLNDYRNAPYMLDGKDKGRVLLLPGTPDFNDFVFEQIKSGNTVVTGPAPENPKKVAYYVRDSAPTQRAVTTNGMEDTDTSPYSWAGGTLVDNTQNQSVELPSGYSVYASPDMLEKLSGGSLEKEYMRRKRAKDNAAYFYPKAEVTAQSNATTQAAVGGLEQLATATVVPHDIQDFAGAYREWAPNPAIWNNPNLPFIDLGKYYVDHNGTLPTSLVGLDPKYYLPGHTNASPEVNKQLGLDPEALAEYRKKTLDEFHDLGPDNWFNKRYRNDSIVNLRQKLYSNSNIGSDTFNHINFIVAAKPTYNQVNNWGLSSQSWNKLVSLQWSPLETEYQLRQTISDNTPESVNTAVAGLNLEQFKLDPVVRSELTHDLYVASKYANKPLTKQQAYDLAGDPSFRPDLKRAFFNLWVYPEGYIGKTQKLTKDSIIESLIDQLK